jgi:hypothetical protein
MAMFAMETSFLIAIAVFAGGLVLLHFGRQASAGLLRAAGLVLLIGSVLAATCTVYWGIRYHLQGDFESAYPMLACGKMHGACGGPGSRWMRHHGTLGPGMMGSGMMERMGPPDPHGMMGGPPAPAPAEPPAAEKQPKQP